MQPIYLAGPTAAGKSAVALELARRLDGEIVSVDSMQVYRGMDIGTAKPSAAERELVPHHLIDIIGLSERFDAARFVDAAKKAESEIRSRGRMPIFCGGTGFYFKALIEGLGTAPASDATVRAELEKTSLEILLTELERVDPVTFQRIDRKNPRRVMRALEVIRITGRPYSEQRSAWQAGRPNVPGYFFGVSRPPHEMVRRIHDRVDVMFRAGLIDETKQLVEQGLEQNVTAMQALGYRQIVEHLRGGRALAETIELVKIRTRQFAKRQLTWFRRQMSLEWISLENLSAAQAAERMARDIALDSSVRQ